ncbi:unnamed protein product, partial [Prorocentrum cordatum]
MGPASRKSVIEDNQLPAATPSMVFASTSGLLGLSRSSDYAAVNGYLNALITFRRTFGACGQANMWGQIAGTGLAGHGTGAAGRGGAGEQVEVPVAPPLPRKQEKRPAEDLEYPKEFYQRDRAGWAGEASA